MATDDHARHAMARTSQQMARMLQRTLKATKKAAGFVLPFRDADPPATDPMNAWMFNDDRIRIRKPDGTIREIVTTTPGSSTSSVALPTVADPVAFTLTYPATWARSFCTLHGVEDAAQLWYGPDPQGIHGVRTIMVGFTDAVLRGDFAGAVVRRVELFMSNADGSQQIIPVTFGAHHRSSSPSSYSAVRRDAWTGDWPKVGDGGWRDLPVAVGRWLQADTAEGLTIEQPDGVTFAGLMSWTSVTLRISATR
jgi:hypothetical protein